MSAFYLHSHINSCVARTYSIRRLFKGCADLDIFHAGEHILLVLLVIFPAVPVLSLPLIRVLLSLLFLPLLFLARLDVSSLLLLPPPVLCLHSLLLAPCHLLYSAILLSLDSVPPPVSFERLPELCLISCRVEGQGCWREECHRWWEYSFRVVQLCKMLPLAV